MQDPLAITLVDGTPVEAHTIRLDSSLRSKIMSKANSKGPMVVVVESATLLHDISTGVIDFAKIVSVSGGDGDTAVLLVVPSSQSSITKVKPIQNLGDGAFLDYVKKNAPQLQELAAQTISALRKGGIDGSLIEEGPRWVNRPLNTFTLKAQPRVGNLHFTLYGNPDTYDAGDFLLRDQNSYSRGWIKTEADISRLVQLLQMSQSRRKQ